ncbi:MAG: hypothetical protein HOP07_01895 [Bacteriovoracaceae bacterium]|nr:hypothetical protein [Bacteriovoracaceae bacterium]
MKNKNPLRVLIETDAQESLDEMLINLKGNGNFVRITPSRLLSWIITKFRTESFEKHKNQIIQEHFNSKEYLRDLATKIQNSDDAAILLTAALEKIQMKSKKMKYKTEKPKKL